MNEVFGWGVYGGFGYLTRQLARGLLEEGVDTCILTPRRMNQKSFEILDGTKIYGYNETPRIIPFVKYYYNGNILNEISHLLKEINADIYHSQEASEYTYMVAKTAPHASHVVTFQDPWSFNEIRMMEKLHNTSRLGGYSVMLYRRWFQQRLIEKALRRMDGVFCQARYIIPKVAKMYGLRKLPEFLPNPVQVPNRNMIKSDEPKVVFLARWDPVKRPELFFQLAREFPRVRFIALGKYHSSSVMDSRLRRQYSVISNLEMPGFVSEEQKSKILEESWILVNTSIHECLPISFLEAAAHKCAILSCENPDDFAGMFGFNAGLGLHSYIKGLRYLLEDERCKALGEKAYEYVSEIHKFDRVIDLHMSAYERLTAN